MANIHTDWGPKTWTENRESGKVTSIDVKIRGWRIINNIDDTPKTYREISVSREVESGFNKIYSSLDTNWNPEIEETYTLTVPEEHQTEKVFYLSNDHVHDHAQGNDGDIEYQEKLEEWIDLLNADSSFLAKIESVKTQLIALGEE